MRVFGQIRCICMTLVDETSKFIAALSSALAHSSENKIVVIHQPLPVSTHWRSVGLGMIRLQRSESGPYFPDFSLHIPDMRNFIEMHEIGEICTRSPTVSLSNPQVRQTANPT